MYIYSLASSSAATNSKRIDLPSKSLMSSSPRPNPMFDKNPPTVTWTVTTALTCVDFSVLGIATAFMALRRARKDRHVLRCTEFWRMGYKALELPVMKGFCHGTRVLVVECWWWWTGVFNILVWSRCLGDRKGRLNKEWLCDY